MEYVSNCGVIDRPNTLVRGRNDILDTHEHAFGHRILALLGRARITKTRQDGTQAVIEIEAARDDDADPMTYCAHDIEAGEKHLIEALTPRFTFTCTFAQRDEHGEIVERFTLHPRWLEQTS